jgi:hypothetical protein
LVLESEDVFGELWDLVAIARVQDRTQDLGFQVLDGL